MSKQTRWEPIAPSESLSEFLEQGALVDISDGGSGLAIAKQGKAAWVDLPEYIRLCRRVAVDAPAIPTLVRDTIDVALMDGMARRDAMTQDEHARWQAYCQAALDWLRLQPGGPP